MFESSYIVDVRRFIRWYAPPVNKQKHFLLWMLVLAISTTGTIFAYAQGLGDKYTSLGILMIFISLYRGLFFDTLYARRQFYASCRFFGRGEEKRWPLRNKADENGVVSYMDDELCHSFSWEQVELCRTDDQHIDFVSGEELIRFEKDSFTKGNAEQLLAWVKEMCPRLPLESGNPIYLPLT